MIVMTIIKLKKNPDTNVFHIILQCLEKTYKI